MQMRVVTHIVCVSSLQSVGLHACHTRVMLRHARVLLYEPSYGLAQQWALSNLVERANDPEIQFFWLGLVFFRELRRFSLSCVRVCPCTWRFTGPTDMVMRVGHFLQLNFCPSPPLWTKEKTLSPLRKPILTSTANVFLIFFFPNCCMLRDPFNDITKSQSDFLSNWCALDLITSFVRFKRQKTMT